MHGFEYVGATVPIIFLTDGIYVRKDEYDSEEVENFISYADFYLYFLICNKKILQRIVSTFFTNNGHPGNTSN